jgi:Alternative complex III, ActD subunit
MADSWCLAKFGQPAGARTAIRRLLQSGVDPDAMEVMTSQPIHGERFLPEKKSTKLRTWALSGAAIGMTAGFLLATVTALNYPIVKGGMPIVAPWTVGIIAYEATMLGAVLATLAGLLFELRLPNFRDLPYDESVADGGVLLAVRCAAGGNMRTAVQDAVSSAGATKVNWV